jgi:hypothetical protein
MYDDDPEHRYLRDVVRRTVAAVIGIDGVDAPLRRK